LEESMVSEEEERDLEKEEGEDDEGGEALEIDDELYGDIKIAITQAFIYGYTEMAKLVKKLNDDIERLDKEIAKSSNITADTSHSQN